MKYSKIVSLFYNILVYLFPLEKYRFIHRWWWFFWNKNQKIFIKSVKTKIHNYNVIVNNGYTYPIYARKFISLNNPLVELVYQAFISSQHSLVVVDVGAAIGDTVLLIESNCSKMVSHYHCVDGDKQFYSYLNYNMRDFANVTTTLAQLSSEDGIEKSLIRTHAGTASAQGDDYSSTVTLDRILFDYHYDYIDVLKIDVDGFDGKVLQGSRRILDHYKPAVIFEWHPILCKNTSNNWIDHFMMLSSCGYTKFLWFSKYGEWHFTMNDYTVETINIMANICIKSTIYPDWHYDIIALHESSTINDLALAETMFAKSRLSRS